jgi:hypothetical protein
MYLCWKVGYKFAMLGYQEIAMFFMEHVLYSILVLSMCADEMMMPIFRLAAWYQYLYGHGCQQRWTFVMASWDLSQSYSAAGREAGYRSSGSKSLSAIFPVSSIRLCRWCPSLWPLLTAHHVGASHGLTHSHGSSSYAFVLARYTSTIWCILTQNGPDKVCMSELTTKSTPAST